MERFWNAEPEEQRGCFMTVVSLNSEGETQEELHLIPALKERLKYYRNKNRSLKGLTKRYTTSKSS